MTGKLVDCMQARKRRDALALEEYGRGRTKGGRWTRENVFARVDHAAPFTADHRDSPFNLGVVKGIAEELRRFADRLDPPDAPTTERSKSSSIDSRSTSTI